LPNLNSGAAQSIIYDQSKYTEYKPWAECQPTGAPMIPPRDKKLSTIAGPAKQQVTLGKSVMVKPQITKEYVNSQVVGKPDFSLLNNNYEARDKFYEP